jgi:hypothetical protein
LFARCRSSPLPLSNFSFSWPFRHYLISDQSDTLDILASPSFGGAFLCAFWLVALAEPACKLILNKDLVMSARQLTLFMVMMYLIVWLFASDPNEMIVQLWTFLPEGDGVPVLSP